jgi:hypothetical protein
MLRFTLDLYFYPLLLLLLPTHLVVVDSHFISLLLLLFALILYLSLSLLFVCMCLCLLRVNPYTLL